jgi:hypothetical protein
MLSRFGVIHIPVRQGCLAYKFRAKMVGIFEAAIKLAAVLVA